MAPGKKTHDGHKCKGPSVLDHIDNNPENNPIDGSNWQELCKGHNARKNPRGRGRYHKTLHGNGKTIINKYRPITIEMSMAIRMRKNLEAEPFIRAYVLKTIKTYGQLDKSDLINAASEEFTKRTEKTISQQAVRSYLEKLLNPINGDLEEIPGELGEPIVKLREKT